MTKNTMNLDEIYPDNNVSLSKAEKQVREYHEAEKSKAIIEVRRRYSDHPSLPPPPDISSSMDMTDLFPENMSQCDAEMNVREFYEIERTKTVNEIRRRYWDYTNAPPTIIEASGSGVVDGSSWLLCEAENGSSSSHDWTLMVVTEGEPSRVVSSFKVHCSVLASKSDYFKTLFEATGFSESCTQASKLVLPRHDIRYVPDFLDFCYGRQVQVDPKTVDGIDKAGALQRMADRLMVQELLKPTEKCLWKFRTPIYTYGVVPDVEAYNALRRHPRGKPIPPKLVQTVAVWLANMTVDDAKIKISIIPHQIQTEIVYLLGPINKRRKYRPWLTPKESLVTEVFSKTHSI